jgi:hypothetical protein
MKEKTVKYVMGRLNLIASYKNKFEYINNSIRKNVIINSLSKRYNYGIFQVENKIIDNEQFIIGTLTKFRPFEEEEKVNLEKGKIYVNEDKNNVVAKSNFMLHVKSGLIAFRPVGNNISENAFRNVFAEIIEKANNDFFVNVDIQIISEEIDVFYSLKNFEKINSVSIHLHPSNPTNREIWKDLDEELKLSQVDTYHTSYKSDRGIVVSENSKIFSEITMAADGYGNARIEGEKEGKKVIASTDRIPVKFDVTEEEDKSRSLTGSIINKFYEIWDRMKK